MKKITKTTVLCFIICMGFVLTPLQAFSKENVLDNRDYYNETYQDFVIPVYNGELNYGVFDEQGNDVTFSFIQNTKDFHLKNEYLKVIHYLKNSNWSLAKTEFIIDSTQSRTVPSTSGWFSKEYRNYVDMKNSYGNIATDVEIGYKIRCSANRDYNGNILSHGQPEISKTFGKAGWFMNDVSTQATNKGKYIAINVSFKACWNVSLIYGIFNTTFISINKIVRNETYPS